MWASKPPGIRWDLAQDTIWLGNYWVQLGSWPCLWPLGRVPYTMSCPFPFQEESGYCMENLWGLLDCRQGTYLSGVVTPHWLPFLMRYCFQLGNQVGSWRVVMTGLVWCPHPGPMVPNPGVSFIFPGFLGFPCQRDHDSFPYYQQKL